MINLFAKVIIPEHIEELQNLQYSEKLLLEDVVPAGGQKLGKVNISSLGHFYNVYITGHFETLVDIIDPPNSVHDDGVDHLRGKLVDGSNQRQLFNDYVPLDLFCTPGRIKSATSTSVLTDPPANSLFYPQVFQYMFTVNSEIIFDVKNDSNVDIRYALLFHGIRLPMAQKETRIKLATKLKLKKALSKV